MLTAEEIMTRNVITVKEDTPIREAMKTMLKEKVSGLPVVYDDMSVAGVLSEKDVLNLLYDKEGLKTQKVRYFMTEHTISFDIDDNLIDICDFLAKGLVRRVPITSNGKLVGIVSVADIMKYTLSL
ncbi:MAG: CBS domain-containing protein [Phycisphaerae bacterium]|nr:CBS domain-containing protein [Phycisphaerae bacterium]NIW72253.1 CBS domain-containing protein [candidate division KSB1 bacterium]NIP56303.1 CBS domain-containing protein [Phycisphaerae bacterium]NIS49676.1 CBS domain-containing protein [Phycisphaerae bacterium]NIU07407.1 CBS domain-containing protein [Phycisphaerae bacterium]